MHTWQIRIGTLFLSLQGITQYTVSLLESKSEEEKYEEIKSICTHVAINWSDDIGADWYD